MQAIETKTQDKYVAELRARRSEEIVSREQRAQRRARFVLGLTDSYRRHAAAARQRLMAGRCAMRAQREYALLSQLGEITQWFDVISTNAACRARVEEANAATQKTLQLAHLENLRDQEVLSADRAAADDRSRWGVLVETRAEAAVRDTEEACRSAIELVLERVNAVIDYGVKHAIPEGMPLPRTLVEYIQLPQEALPSAIVQGHVDLSLYRFDPVTGGPLHNPAFTAMMQRAARFLHPRPSPPRPLDPKPWPIVIIAGPMYSGKSVIARHVAERLGMLYLCDAEMVSHALAELNGDINPEDMHDPVRARLIALANEARSALFSGEALSHEFMARLIMHHIAAAPDDCAGIIIDGSILTAEGIAALETQLTGGAKADTCPALLLAPGTAEDASVSARLDVKRPQPVLEQPTQSREKARDKAKRKGRDDDEPLPPVDLPPLIELPPLSEEQASILASAEGAAMGISRVIAINCPPNVLFDRLSKVRYDTETGEEYHMDHHPPPLERLAAVQPPERTETDTARIYDAADSYAARWKEAESFIRRCDPSVLVTVGNDQNEDMGDLIETVVQLVTEAAQLRRAYTHHIAEAVAIKEHRGELAEVQRCQNLARDAAKRQLLQLYQDRGVEPLPAELTAPDWAPTPFLSLTQPLAELLMNMLSDFTKSYRTVVSESHDELQRLLTGFYDHILSCEVSFGKVLLRGDGRQDLLDVFIEKDMMMRRDLRTEAAAKDELHLRISNLHDALRRMADSGRDEALQILEGLCSKTAFTEPASEGIRTLGALLVQAELDRFIAVRQLVLTYYHGMMNDPVAIDASEMALIDIVPVRGVPTEAPQEPAKGSRSRATPTGGKKKPQATADEVPCPPEEMLTFARDKARSTMEQLLDKLTLAPAPVAPVRGRKGATEVPRVDENSPGALSAPIVADELALCMKRVNAIVGYFTELTDQLAAITLHLRDKLRARLREDYMKQMAAINGVVTYLRQRVEEASPVSHRLLLSRSGFAVDRDAPLPDTDAVGNESGEGDEVEVDRAGEDTLVLSCLTFSRLSRIIHLFKVCAPHYRLHRDDFLRIIKVEDYTPKGMEELSAPVEVVFDRFDIWHAGLIDWREFVVHVLLWCEPVMLPDALTSCSGPFGGGASNEFHVAGPSLLQLFDLRSDLGALPLDQESFLDVPLFFEDAMGDDRLNSYLSILWETFAQGDLLDPDVFVMFLCADEQPLRGMQKAFAMASPPADEPCALTPEQLDKIFHFSSANPRALGVADPYSAETLKEVFSAIGAEELSFQDLCGTHAGRVLLNNAKTFEKKSFAK